MLVNQLLLFMKIVFLLIRKVVFRLLKIFLSLIDSFLTNNFIFQEIVEAVPGQNSGCAVIPGLGTLGRLLSALIQLSSLSPEAVKLLVFALMTRNKFEMSRKFKLSTFGNEDSEITLRKTQIKLSLIFLKIKSQIL